MADWKHIHVTTYWYSHCFQSRPTPKIISTNDQLPCKKSIVGRDWGHREWCDGRLYRAINPPCKYLPKAFYSDRFSVFRVNRKDNLSYEPVTQFQRALSVLNVNLICANSPQAKGRVERANQTLQDRLVKEMRLSRINSYAEANQYLPKFIAEYNHRFAVSPASSLDFHQPLDDTLDLPFLFSIHDFRKVTKTLQIHYAGKVYQIMTHHPAYYYADQEVLITCDASGSVSAWFHGNLLTLEEVEKRSRQAVIVSSKSEQTNPLPPAYDHPWRTYGKKINGKPVLNTLSTE